MKVSYVFLLVSMIFASQVDCMESTCETIGKFEVEFLQFRGALKGDFKFVGPLMMRSSVCCKLPVLLKKINRQLEFEEKKIQVFLSKQENQQKKSELNQSYRYMQNRHAQKQLKLQDKVQFKKNKKLPKSQQRMQVAHRTR